MWRQFSFKKSFLFITPRSNCWTCLCNWLLVHDYLCFEYHWQTSGTCYKDQLLVELHLDTKVIWRTLRLKQSVIWNILQNINFSYAICFSVRRKLSAKFNCSLVKLENSYSCTVDARNVSALSEESFTNTDMMTIQLCEDDDCHDVTNSFKPLKNSMWQWRLETLFCDTRTLALLFQLM